jgi:adenylate cyclase class 2
MASEIEKKYRLTPGDLERLSEDLRELGAEYSGEVSEENLIFSGELLMRRNAVVRIRKTERGSTLTFKRYVPDEPGFKHHIEHETVIGDPSEVESMLREMELELVIVYEKRRRTWRVRDAEVVLDELPFGLFMEIEGDPAAIREAEMILDAEGLEYEPETYPRLTQVFGKKNLGVYEARFG